MHLEGPHQALAVAGLDARGGRGIMGAQRLAERRLAQAIVTLLRFQTDRLGDLGDVGQPLGQGLEIEPGAAVRIAPGDRQRLVRAFEVQLSTGRALSDWQASTSPLLAPDAWRAVVLAPPRAELYARCDARFAAMVAAGALTEVRALAGRGLDSELPVMKAVGVRELTRHLAGELELGEAIALAQQETRRYAKRQMTWLRRQTADWPVIEADDAETQWRQFLALQPALTLP